jgi:O-acetyl-ADP-ribose deacetylase (regulator of RNase III)|tara:strand:- start:10394 stop:10843 length:450 start_codon:yes stop_codon:yes gene_type:complete
MSNWKLKNIEGNLVRDAKNYDVIIQGCNCFCTQGAGIALTIKNKWPQVYAADLETTKGDINKLGTYTMCVVPETTVINAYTQYDYKGKKPVDYDAIRSVMKSMKVDFAGKSFGIPLIGAGLAGGDWEVIEAIIAKELVDEDVTIVHFKG